MIIKHTNTSTSLVASISEGLLAVERIESDGSVNYLPRIVGISVLAAALIAFAVCKALPVIIEKRRKNG